MTLSTPRRPQRRLRHAALAPRDTRLPRPPDHKVPRLSVAFGRLRRARRHHQGNPAGLAPDADIREILDDDPDLPDGFELVTSWVFHGQGYLDLDTAAAAVHSAAMARIR
ncbi:MAG TPA: hypothetical protein VLB29_06445 [Nocardioidaceae bacterium]|nr:hypothetical protein [Nocardioidaceae bacterium]